MQNNTVYTFTINGNYTQGVQAMSNATQDFVKKGKEAQSFVTSFASKLAVFDLASNYVAKLSSTINGLSQSGIRLDSQMHDLSAVAGVTGDGLKQIEKYARASAKAFGTDAGTAVEGYKLLLSQLSPELGKYPEALSAMGNAIQTTSKLMGNDGVAAAEVLTTAMNQYGVSLDDPMQASREMARMMNVMAAAGQAGSAELPAIKVALEQSGMAAKAAGVSFEETNAAIQVLDKAGKKGSEGGVALRNVMTTLAKGRFLPKDVQKELKGAGVDIKSLTDTTKPLKVRLETLKPVLKDSALFTKLFGTENANAARALVDGTDLLGEYTEAVTGTNSAEEQAAIVMDSFAEKQARAQQKVEDFKISLFEATNGFTFYVGKFTDVLVPISQMIPLVSGLGTGIQWVKSLKWGEGLANIAKWGRQAAISIALMNSQEAINNRLSLGFFGNIGRVVIQLVRLSTVGVVQALKGLGALALSFITTGGASVGFAATASASFAAFRATAVSACRAVSIAIMNIPIVGWIAAGIAAVIALVTTLWNKCEGFREVVYGVWEVVKVGASEVWNFVKPIGVTVWGWVKSFASYVVSIPTRIYNTILSVWGKIRSVLSTAYKWLSNSVFKPVVDFFKNLWTNTVKPCLDKIVGLLAKVFNPIIELWNSLTGKVVATFKVGAAKGRASWERDHPNEKKDKDKPDSKKPKPSPLPVPQATVDPTNGTLSGGSGSSSESKIRNINIHVDKLIETFTISTTNLHESAERVKEAVGQALLSALNDVNLAY